MTARAEVLTKITELTWQRKAGGHIDGWLYGMLKQEFDLTPDELNAVAESLGFKYGWNPTLKMLLEEQWQKEETQRQERERLQKKYQNEQELQALRVKKQDLQDTAARLKKIRKLEAENAATALLKDYLQTRPMDRPLTELEKSIVFLVLNMQESDQTWLLETIYHRYKS
ncbi:MAG: hypothetical protein VKJ24_02210 [Synechococcales bacterium]|nr:hypothetical protein [Synechococcales bacterium]